MNTSQRDRGRGHICKFIFINALRKGGQGPLSGVGKTNNACLPLAAFAFSGRYFKQVRAILGMQPRTVKNCLFNSFKCGGRGQTR